MTELLPLKVYPFILLVSSVCISNIESRCVCESIENVSDVLTQSAVADLAVVSGVRTRLRCLFSSYSS